MSIAMNVTRDGVGRPAPSRHGTGTSTKALMSTADTLLLKVDEAYVFSVTERRHFPTFAKSELEVGSILGTGGFCVVREIRAFNLAAVDKERCCRTTVVSARGLEKQADGVVKDGETQESQSNDKNKATPKGNKPKQVDEFHGDDEHYEVDTAHEQMVERCLSDENARYAVKRLRKDLSAPELARAMIDLAIEAKFLSALWHPNIVKMRGLAAESALMTPDYFIILDRLYGTLYDKMQRWLSASNKSKGIFGIGKNKMMLHDLKVERLLVAYDLASALRYIHDQRLVYRDIKPENIGFDIRGDVKVFDFGLCKSLEPTLKVRGGYLLTGRTGSIPYMAPEVALSKPYDNKCDVFSFAVLLWEILAIEAAFKGFTKKEFLNRVMLGTDRLPIKKTWPPLTRAMLVNAWHQDPTKRPDMKSIATLIRNDLNDMTKDDSVLHRTQHMADRSQHSLTGRITIPPDI